MRSIYLVFRRDYLGYVKAWGFWIGILSLPMLAVIGAMLGGYAANSAPVRYYAVVEEGTTFTDALDRHFNAQYTANEEAMRDALQDMEMQIDESDIGPTSAPAFIRIEAPATTIDGLRPFLLGDKDVDGPAGRKQLFAVIIVPPGGGEIEYWSEDVQATGLKRATRFAALRMARQNALEAAGMPADFLETVDDGARTVAERRIRTAADQIETGDEVTFADRAPYFVAGGIAYVLWLMIFSVMQYLLMGTIEERSNKIFDSLLTSVGLTQLLAGKLLAVFAVTLTMMAFWAGGLGLLVTYIASMVPAEVLEPIRVGIAAALDLRIIVPALISFVLGYLMFGSLFLAIGSLCDTIQEAQTLLSPMIMLLMLPMLMIVLAFTDPNSPVVAVMSWVPIFTPFTLILRMPTNPPMWEVFAQIGIMAVSTFVILWMATKIYRAGAVHGAGVSDALDWLKGWIPGLGRKKAKAET